MFVADVFAETAEELRRIEKERGRKVADCHRQWQRRWQSRLPSETAKGNGKRRWQRFRQGRKFCVLTEKSESMLRADY